MIFRTLRADEIECRIGSVGQKGFTLLLYKDARCDMNILDETVTPFGWQRRHKEIKGTVYCGVGIDGNVDGYGSMWVWKWDAGSESYTEKEKGEASDSFKRACVNWGIGRELYTAPLIFIPAQTEQDGRGYKLVNRRDGFGYTVDEIEYQDGRISKLRITKNGEQKFFWEMDPFTKNAKQTITPTQVSIVADSITKQGRFIDEICNYYHISKLEEMTVEMYSDFARRFGNA